MLSSFLGEERAAAEEEVEEEEVAAGAEAEAEAEAEEEEEVVVVVVVVAAMISSIFSAIQCMSSCVRDAVSPCACHVRLKTRGNSS